MTTLAHLRHRTSLLRRALIGLTAAAATILAACTTAGASDRTPAKPSIGLYELRVYTTSPGKMDALDARFRDHTIGLFPLHGMFPVGFFHVAPPAGQPADNRLIYIMGYKDRAARDKAWTEFAADTEWQKVYKDSEANGALLSKAPESTFLTVTDYSPALNMTPSARPRHFELRTYTVMPGRLEDL